MGTEASIRSTRHLLSRRLRNFHLRIGRFLFMSLLPILVLLLNSLFLLPHKQELQFQQRQHNRNNLNYSGHSGSETKWERDSHSSPIILPARQFNS